MALADRLAALFAEIDEIGKTPEGGYRRFAFTDEDAALRAFFRTQVEARGMAYEEDTAGNQWGWYGEGRTDAVVTGSHLDSVPDGGAFDGPLGVLSALLAFDELKERGITPRRPIAVVNFTEEEGGRFPLACRGSRLLTGVVGADDLDQLTDSDGITFAEARGAATFAPDPKALERIGHYVELHVEQGRNLATMSDAPLAVADAIWPHGRWRITIDGVADHAGTTRLVDRDDALLKAAHLIIAIRQAAEATGTLATVGKLDVEPGAINAIPSRVTLFLDARAPEVDDLDAVVHKISTTVTERGASIERISLTPATHFDTDLVADIAERFALPVLGTGAGHDAGILADAGVRATMLFVRNPTGTSHSPHESAELSDCAHGIEVLTDVLAYLAAKEGR